MKNIVIIVPYINFLKNFNGDLIKKMAQSGHRVIVFAPDMPDDLMIESLGIYKPVRIPLRNTGINPFMDLMSIVKLMKLLKQMAPDMLLLYSIKPIVYGSIAARLAKLTNVNLFVTGLGYVFIGNTFKHNILFLLVTRLYKLAIQHCQNIFFENIDDLTLFNAHHLIRDTKKAIIINGSGVNIETFPYIQAATRPITFLMIARMIKDKGIIEFIEAASIMKAKYPEVNFYLLGPFDRNPSRISRTFIDSWVKKGIITYLGETDDVRPFLSNASVFVLPSYREGTPKSVLEAMAMGLPIITTDVPGCRETVRHNVNGFLVPQKSSTALAQAMEKFIVNPGLIRKMGKSSREIVMEKYDVSMINDVIFQHIGLSKKLGGVE